MSFSRLLYFEDDAYTAHYAKIRLAELGFQVEVVRNAEEGLQKLGADKYELVLLDYRLPGRNGLEILQDIQRLADPPAVVMVTGVGSEELAASAIKQGAIDYLVKDVESRFLEQVPVVAARAARQRQTEAARREAEAARELLLEELESFAQTVAHDLKSPLYNVRLNLPRLRKLREMDKVSANNLIDEFDASLAQMNKIIDDLLLLATTQTEAVEWEVLDMRSLVDAALQRFEHLANSQEVQIEIAEQLPNALGYAGWVVEVWANYLSNAMKYAGKKARIEIGGTPVSRDEVRFWVRDNGPGISPDEASRLFRPFSRTRTDIADGHGLGLSIVRRIIEKLEGRVGVEVAEGGGALFYFTLPRA